MTVLIIHGIQGYAGIHWQGWLAKELKKKGHKVIMPDLPQPNHPDRQECLKFISDIITQVPIEEALILVGHSLGVTTALDYIESGKRQIHGLASVSGFARDYQAELNSYFLKEKAVDFAKVRKYVDRAVVFYGNDDPYVPQKELAYVAEQLNVKPIVIAKGGHLNTNAGYTQFLLLLKEIINCVML